MCGPEYFGVVQTGMEDVELQRRVVPQSAKILLDSGAISHMITCRFSSPPLIELYNQIYRNVESLKKSTDNREEFQSRGRWAIDIFRLIRDLIELLYADYNIRIWCSDLQRSQNEKPNLAITI